MDFAASGVVVPEEAEFQERVSIVRTCMGFEGD